MDTPSIIRQEKPSSKRTDFFVQRIWLMQEWADYVAGWESGLKTEPERDRSAFTASRASVSGSSGIRPVATHSNIHRFGKDHPRPAPPELVVPGHALNPAAVPADAKFAAVRSPQRVAQGVAPNSHAVTAAPTIPPALMSVGAGLPHPQRRRLSASAAVHSSGTPRPAA